MLNDFLNDINNKMNDCLVNFNNKISDFNVNNNINLNLIYNLCINYYGNNIKLNKLINIVVNDNNSLKISLFDKNIKNKVRNVIESLNLNITSNLDGDDIIINLPIITEDYRRNILNLLKKQLELFKINIRNIRCFFRKKFINLLKSNILSKNDNNILINKLDKITLNYINLLILNFNKKKKNILN